MSCNNQTKQNCGSIIYATCVKYEGTVSSNSPLDLNNCLSVSETTQDIYNQIDDIDTKIDMSTLASSCLPVLTTPTLISVLNQLRAEVCTLKDTVATQGAAITTLQGQVAALQANPCS